MSALLERGTRASYVTHLYALAHGFFERSQDNALFFRAGSGSRRDPDLQAGYRRALRTGYGADLYNSIFSSDAVKAATHESRPETSMASRAVLQSQQPSGSPSRHDAKRPIFAMKARRQGLSIGTGVLEASVSTHLVR